VTAIVDQPLPSETSPADRRDHLAELRDAVASLGRRSTADADRWLLVAGAVLVPTGVLAVVAGYRGAANAPRVIQQIPYQISSGFLGLAFVFASGFAYFAWWLTRIVREQRRVADRVDAQTAALTRELAELRRVLDGRLPNAPVVELVATRAGTMAHVPTCSIVAGRADLRPAPAGAKPCRACRTG
jgi:hypothetical protein